MSRIVPLMAALALVAAGGLSQAQAQPKTRAGVLTCNVAGGVGLILGSQKATSCTFRPRRGPAETYTGVIRKFGLDIGATKSGVITWAVIADGSMAPGSLAGTYVGGTGEATIGGGVGTNILVGGSNRSISLQPLSVSRQRGLNLAVGVGDLELRAGR
ncbi:DUF992 domain-containing protein [Microvirga pudoricolor]|uniref:DUF992 domain-containing protein n=1 Tax=Microvirga pudoricolor TaxID=2778729 RepID=UPI00194FDFF5|nr:DUF992 domain-containing protein [Microvirga pudoricolor]MBM6592443.1 DUF992 domain-containing protein [Microvirga pudoricolor]